MKKLNWYLNLFINGGDIMNNKGFTLVELILVISVLAMLALLSTPSITRMIEQNKVNNYNSTSMYYNWINNI